MVVTLGPVGEGSDTYNFLPKVNRNACITSRELIIFLTNHGLFRKYFYKIGKISTPMCICNHLSDSLHYILSCPLTQLFWFQHVLQISNARTENNKLYSCWGERWVQFSRYWTFQRWYFTCVLFRLKLISADPIWHHQGLREGKIFLFFLSHLIMVLYF